MEYQKVQTDEIVRNVSSQYNDKTSKRHYINEVQFSFHNHREIMQAIENGQAVDLVNLPKRKTKVAMVIGSGPTLDAALPYMADWRGEIICSTSHASTLIAYGREPEHIVALDPDSHPGELAADTWEGRNSTLHLHPGVSPGLVRWWKGPISLFRKLQPQTTFYGSEQAIGYSPLGPFRESRYWGDESRPLITAQVPMLACVAPAQISIGKHLGYKQLILVGCDFSCPGDKYRFTSKTWEDGKWVEHEPEPLEVLNERCAKIGDPIVETEFDGLKSTPMQIFYSHQTVIGWRLVEVNIINSSHEGLLRMMPYQPLEDIIRAGNKGVKGFTLPQIRNVSEEHLAKQNIYFLYVGNGIMPHEFKDPLHEIPKIIPQLKAQLEAQGRGAELDIEANMRRIKRLFDKVVKG